MSASPGTPSDQDEPVGATLARMRRLRGLTGAQLAREVDMSQPKISRIERGIGTPDPTDVGALARALGADDGQVRALVERSERLHNRMTDWRPVSPDVADRQRTVGAWEAEAAVVRDFQPALLAGLLQTSGYARAALQAFVALHLDLDQPSEADIRAAVAARIDRQQVLADPSKQFRFVVAEAVLRNQICSPAAMIEQIDALREVTARQSNITIGVIPDGASSGVPQLHGFTLFDDRLVVIDLYNTGLTSRGRTDVASYHHVFDGFERRATTDIGPVLDRYREAYIEQLRRPG